MPRFRFRGFANASTVALSIAQGANSVDASVQAWGQTPGSGDAQLTIDALDDAYATEVGAFAAPSSVHLEARPTGFVVDEVVLPSPAFADTPATLSENVIYDPAFHEIHYFWDVDAPFGSATTFSNDPNIPDIWNNRHVAYGKKVAFVMDVPGLYTFTCYAVDAEGARAVASITRTAVSADSVYPMTQTLCVNPAGDTNFDWTPTGALEYSTGANDLVVLDTAFAAFTALTTNCRLLFKPGVTFNYARSSTLPAQPAATMVLPEEQGTVDSREHRIFIGGGAGTAPILNCGWNASGIVLPFRSYYHSVTIDNLDLRSGWNADFEVGLRGGQAINSNVCTHLTIHRAKAPGWGGPFSYGASVYAWNGDILLNTEGKGVFPARHCFSECEVNGWATFGQFVGKHGKRATIDYPGRSKLAHIATKMIQSPDAINVQKIGRDGGGGSNVHNDSSPYRIAYTDDIYFGCCDTFSNNGIGGHQAPFRLNNGMVVDGTRRFGFSYYNIDRCVLEGGSQPLGVSNVDPDAGMGGPNATGRHPCNVMADKLLLVGTAFTSTLGVLGPGACTVRNTMGVIPNTAGSPTWPGASNLFNMESITADERIALVRAQKWRLHNVTAVVLRTTENNRNVGTISLVDAGHLALMDDALLENNITHWPNVTNAVNGGVTGTTIAGFTPRYKGRNDNFARFGKAYDVCAPGATFDVLYSEIPTTTLEGRACVNVPANNAAWQQYWTTNPTHDFHYIIDNSLWRSQMGQLGTVQYLSDRIRFTNNTGETLFTRDFTLSGENQMPAVGEILTFTNEAGASTYGTARVVSVSGSTVTVDRLTGPIPPQPQTKAVIGSAGLTATTTSSRTDPRVFIDRRALHPGVDPATATPTDLPVLWTPIGESPAITSEDQGLLAVDDFLLQTRTVPRTRGAVEVFG